MDFEKGLIFIPEGRILKLKSSLVSCLQNAQIVARRTLLRLRGKLFL